MRAPGHGRLVWIAVEGAVVDTLRLEIDHRIVVLDRGDQETFRVVGIRRHHDLEARDVGEERLGTLRVGLAAADAAAAGRAHGHRCVKLAGAPVSDARELAHDLVVGRIDVVGELDLGHRPEPVNGHADRGRENTAFRDRRIEHAAFAVFPLQPVGDAKDAAEEADVLAEDDDRRVLSELDIHRRIQRLDHVHLSHGVISRLFLRAIRLPAGGGARASP